MDSQTRKAASYSRVSTLLNQTPEHQLVAIREFAAARNFEIANEFVDHGISGAKERRPALDALLAEAKRGRFKVVIVSAIDRCARNTLHLLRLINELDGYGVAFISLRENIDLSTPMGRATLTILGAIAELERELIRERIRTALAAKKLIAQQRGTGWRSGRPTLVTPDIKSEVLTLRENGLSIRKIHSAINAKISSTSIQNILTEAKNANHAQ